MTTLAPTEPACPGSTDADRHTPNRSSPPPAAGDLRVIRTSFSDVPRATWDRLAAANPWATPFSGWAFQRAWWDAYGESAHDQTTVVCRATPNGAAPADDPIAIVPLMHRHEVEPGDVDQATKIRHGDAAPMTAVAAGAKAIFFGASYHADYATILGAPGDLAAVSAALAGDLADVVRDASRPGPIPWDVVDLRRLRCGDPSADALAAAFGRHEADEGWRLDVEREDVCPVVTFPEGGSFDDYLSTLDKKARHEIRRKIRRAEGAGDVRLVPSTDPLTDLEVFIDLHQKRWGADGLFPPTPGGDASRVFIRRLFEECGGDGPVRLSFLHVGDRRIAAGIHVETADTWMFYNAGIDPDARDLSPGVLLAAKYVESALDAGARRFDFLRGNEPYKYEWGAVDEPIQRLLVRRDGADRGDADPMDHREGAG